MEFSGASVRIARVFRGLTQRQLAQEVETSEASIWQIEKGRHPSETLLKAIGLVLGFEPGFFFGPVLDELTEGDCNFRRRATAAQRLRKRVLARGTLYGMVLRYLNEQLVLPAYRVPELRADASDEIEAVAAQCRARWQLGQDTPIANMTRVLEHAGVTVNTLADAEAEKLDAFSRRGRDGKASIVALNLTKGSTSRTRFDMAHELGHLVLHRERERPLKEREWQANRFAAAFLLPRDGFARDFWFGGGVNWSRVFELKARWKVSIQAMVHRAYDLDLIDAVEFRRAYKRISARGWRKQEPQEPPPEHPEVFRKAMHVLWERKGIGAPDAAKALQWSVETFQDVTGFKPAVDGSPHGRGLSLVKAGNPLRRTAAYRP